MGTRSNIIIKVKKKDIGRILTHTFKGKEYQTKIEKPYLGIYCHWDGYVDGVGRELLEEYNDYEKVLALISGGNASSVIDGVDYYMSWERDEVWSHNCPRQTDKPEVTMGWTEYAYVFKNGKWYVGIVKYHKNGSETINYLVELTEDVIENGHPKERD